MPRIDIPARSFVLRHPCGHEEQRHEGELMPCAECHTAPKVTVGALTFERLRILLDPAEPLRRIHTWCHVWDAQDIERWLKENP